ncbi:MAG TPA: MoaD/ThiS family protein [Acidimicrobiales bacterium]|nr:MoaD/ThiS family protein [Acidimicrobiales bacterium]
MARLILLGPAHEVAGTREDFFDGATLDAVLNEAVLRYGTAFEELLSVSQVWLNGEPASRSSPVEVHDEVTVLPPVSGG